MRLLCLVACWALAEGSCDQGFLYQGRGVPASTNLPNAKACQKLCSQSQYCTHFSYDLGSCWFLRDSSGLQKKSTAVSGPKFCVMSEEEWVDDSGETADEQSQRIHEMVVRIASYVQENSQNVATVAKAAHLKWSVENGFMREEGYEKIMSVLNSASMLFSAPGGFVHAASQGLLPTREDLDWLLQHCTGESPVNEEHVPEESLPIGGDTPCNHLRGCDTGKSFGAGTPWTNAEVKYCYDVNLRHSAREAIDCAISKINQALPGIRFTNVGTTGHGACAMSPAIFIQSSDRGCWANIGMTRSFFGMGGEQKLNLQTPGCDDCGTATHEMLHAMGVAHEQSRPDRDQYIVINWQNIQSGMASQFAIDQKADHSRPYDILSIMHYGSTAFTRNGMATIAIKAQGYELYTQNPDQYRYFRPGQRMGMSQSDIDQLADLYDCVTPNSCAGIVGPEVVTAMPSPVTPGGGGLPFSGGAGVFPFELPDLGLGLTQEQTQMLILSAVVSCVICSALSCLCSCGGSSRAQYRYVR